MRLNRGGSDALANQLAARLTRRPYLAYRKQARNDPAEAGSRTRAVPVYIGPHPGPRYTGPLAVLTGSLTVSAGETRSFYVNHTGIAWRYMPHDLPPWQTVYWYFKTWTTDGIFTDLNYSLNGLVRTKAGPATPSLQHPSWPARA